jgi:UDP-glucose 4-epimerase
MELAGKRVLVTGGAGFIGSELVRQLSVRGAEVTVIDNLANGLRENLEDCDEVALVEADVRDGARMHALARQSQVIFHLACLGVRHSIHAPRENHEVNAEGTLTMLLAARAAGIERFVCVSSSEVYGTALWAPMNEQHPTYPRTVYGSAKLAGECYARAFHDTFGLPSLVVRPFNAYGPRCHHEGDSGEVIPRFLLRCMADRPMIIFGDGTQTRDFTYVEDTARGIIAAGIEDAAVGQTVNLGTGREVTISRLSQEVGAVLGRPSAEVTHSRARPGDVRRLCADISRARALCGFEPRVSLAQGLAKLKDWYIAQGKAPDVLLESEIVENWKP